MKKRPFLLLISVLWLGFSQVSMAQTWQGHSILHESSNCDVRTSGATVLRCVGTSGWEQMNQLSTLIFHCFLGNLSLSLGHATVNNEVIDYRFEDNLGRVAQGVDHTKVSKVRTGFSESIDSVPEWIFRNMTDENHTNKLSYFLNGKEVQGQFEFSTNDQQLFKIFLDFCRVNREFQSER